MLSVESYPMARIKFMAKISKPSALENEEKTQIIRSFDKHWCNVLVDNFCRQLLIRFKN